jgi:hypothetical protein
MVVTRVKHEEIQFEASASREEVKQTREAVQRRDVAISDSETSQASMKTEVRLLF